MKEATIRVSIVDDLDEVRETLKAAIDETEDMVCVSNYPDAEEALTGLEKDEPDIVIMDIGLPRMSGIECMLRIKLKKPDMRFMMFTVFDHDSKVFEALKAGADGYILKHESFENIIENVRELHAGGAPMSRHIARKVMRSFRRLPETEGGEKPLTPREIEILENLSRGLLYKEIADQMEIRIGTVKQHIHNVYKKLHVQNKTEAINKYLNR